MAASPSAGFGLRGYLSAAVPNPHGGTAPSNLFFFSRPRPNFKGQGELKGKGKPSSSWGGQGFGSRDLGSDNAPCVALGELLIPGRLPVPKLSRSSRWNPEFF